MTAFRDQLARSILDRDHGADEERWVTLGAASTGNLLVVVHTWLCTLGSISIPIAARCVSSRPVGRRRTKRVSIARTRRHEGRIRFFESRTRGRFFRQNAVLAPPVHLDPEILEFLTARAEARGMSLNDLVNALLRKDIELIEAAE